MNINSINGFSSIEQVTNQYLNNQNKPLDKTSNAGLSFEEILKQQSEVKFSKHASQRLQDRNINLSEEQLQRLNAGIEKANEKGVNESLMIVDNMTFIVNVKNNTVVTALDLESSKDNVFTNIDGAVIV